MAAPRFVEVKIENITLFQYNFIILLRHKGEENVLPICVAAAEARSIAAAFNNQNFPRPLTHDLMKSIFGTLGCEVLKVHVTDLRDGTFYALIFLQRPGGEVLEIDARPSDAIALAIRYGAPIYVRDDILRENAVNINQTGVEHLETHEDETPDEDEKVLDPREALQRKLTKAIAEERYEDAAKLRDDMAQLETDN